MLAVALAVVDAPIVDSNNGSSSFALNNISLGKCNGIWCYRGLFFAKWSKCENGLKMSVAMMSEIQWRVHGMILGSEFSWDALFIGWAGEK